MEKTERFGFWLSSNEKSMLTHLAKFEGGLSQAALIRRLIRQAAQKYGIWVIDDEEHISYLQKGADNANYTK